MESAKRVRNTQAYVVMKIGRLKIKPLARSGCGEGGGGQEQGCPAHNIISTRTRYIILHKCDDAVLKGYFRSSGFQTCIPLLC
jgi:hypothetical protein